VSRGIGHEATRSVRKTGAVGKAGTRKAGSRSNETGHCQHRCKKALHGRVPCSVPLPVTNDLNIEATSGFIVIASISATLLSSDRKKHLPTTSAWRLMRPARNTARASRA
jgi:hypothetical protein